jgi:hypothetical protein
MSSSPQVLAKPPAAAIDESSLQCKYPRNCLVGWAEPSPSSPCLKTYPSCHRPPARPPEHVDISSTGLHFASLLLAGSSWTTGVASSSCCEFEYSCCRRRAIRVYRLTRSCQFSTLMAPLWTQYQVGGALFLMYCGPIHVHTTMILL